MRRMGRAQGVVVACVTVALAACSGPSSTAPSTQTPTPTVTAAAVTLTPNSWDLPAGGGSVEITIATSANAAGNVIAPNVAVRLQASSGSLSDSEPRTDNTGHALFRYAAHAEGVALGDIAVSVTVRIDGTPPMVSEAAVRVVCGTADGGEAAAVVDRALAASIVLASVRQGFPVAIARG